MMTHQQVMFAIFTRKNFVITRWISAQAGKVGEEEEGLTRSREEEGVRENGKSAELVLAGQVLAGKSKISDSARDCDEA